MDEFFNNQSGNQNNQQPNPNQYYSPQQNNFQQPKQTYYQPPTYTVEQPPVVENGYGMPPVKKKRRKAPWVILIIVLICVGVALAGVIGNSGNLTDRLSDSKPSTSQSEESKSDAPQASVEKSAEAAKTDNDGNLTAAGVAQKAIDSCVGITVYTKQDAYSYFYGYGYGQQQQSGNGDEVASGEGSGIIMLEDSGKTYILTCAHVIADGSSFKVTTNDDKEYDATMVGYDSQTDIGVLAIDKTGFQVATFGDSKDIEVGEECVAIGCPGGLEFKNSVTKGIVSALDVPVSSSIGYKNECIQVDAAINPGNSGGALFNMQGQVIGINSSKIASTEYEGMGFAVPSNTAIETANSLIKNGYVTGRAKVGIKYNSLGNYNNASAILAALSEKGYKDAQGTMVIQEVSDESDLKDKVQQYDMIVAVEGQTMTSTDIMTSTLANKKPGDTITITIARVKNNSIDTFEVKCKLIENKQ